MSSSKPDLQKALAELKDILAEAHLALDKPNSLEENESNRIKFLGRKSQLISILRDLKMYSDEDKRVLGSEANKTKLVIEELINQNQETLLKSKHSTYKEDDKVD